MPEAVLRALDGHDLPGHVGLTFPLLTVDASGWPHVALLSAGEVLAVGESELRLALWPGSETTANLTRDGRGTLMVIAGATAFYLELEARPASPGDRLALFTARVRRVLADEVAYARITTGISFDLPDPASVLGRWRDTIGALRGLG